MTIARVENGVVLERRPLNMADIPEHKRALWRPVFEVGSGDDIVTTIEADRVVDTRLPRLVLVDDVARERDRRLALGFDYNFGDSRGVHRIGTTARDMSGWAEVSTYAGALIDSGDLTTQIAIATDTGTCAVTAPEWRAIEIAAAAFRQPLWAASFVLMGQTPIPADYANAQYWP